MADITFKLDQSGGAEILQRNYELQKLEQRAFDSVISDIEAQFFQTFGVEGKFVQEAFTTNRYNIKISAADKRTGAILKANPGWLGKFTTNINI